MDRDGDIDRLTKGYDPTGSLYSDVTALAELAVKARDERDILRTALKELAVQGEYYATGWEAAEMNAEVRHALEFFTHDMRKLTAMLKTAASEPFVQGMMSDPLGRSMRKLNESV